MFSNPSFDDHESVTFVRDARCGLAAIIAIHSTSLGPAMGGSRLWQYATDSDGLTDALRLSRGMSYKNALARLPIGGGKAVILRQGSTETSEALLEAFGEAVEKLGGRYITAEDVGMSVKNMQIIARKTAYVSGLPTHDDRLPGGDPSPMTARGVFHGLSAAVRFTLGRSNLAGLRVAVQGLGGVGYNLCRELHAAGARLVVADLDSSRVLHAQEQFGAATVGLDEILYQKVDVLAPCALGAVLDATSISHLNTRIVAGGANNQLLEDADGQRLLDRGITYVPDYVINAGGIISVAAQYLRTMSQAEVSARIASIADRVTAILEESAHTGLPSNVVADRQARDCLARPHQSSASQ